LPELGIRRDDKGIHAPGRLEDGRVRVVGRASPRPRVRSARHTRLEYHANPGTGGNQHPIPVAHRGA